MLNHESSEWDLWGQLQSVISLSHRPLSDIVLKAVVSFAENCCGELCAIFLTNITLESEQGEKTKVFFFMQCNQKVLWIDDHTHFRAFTILPSKKYFFSTIVYWCLDTHVYTHSSLLKSFHSQLQFSHLCEEVWLLENLHLLLLVPLSFLLPCFKK